MVLLLSSYSSSGVIQEKLIIPPLYLTSGTRPGSIGSSHQYGDAADISMKHGGALYSNPCDIKKKALVCGFKRVCQSETSGHRMIF